MAVQTAIVTASLGTDTTPVNFTSSGFGTPDAAIVIVNGAESGNNPNSLSPETTIGFYDGTNQCRIHLDSRRSGTGVVGGYAGDITYTAASVTDGISLTLSGSTSIARYATVLLIKGVNAALVGNFVASSSGTVTTTGVNPNFIFFTGIGSSPANSYVSSNDLTTVGAARIDGSSNITNIGVFYSLDEQDQIVKTADSFGQHVTTANWYGRVTSFGTGQFGYTASGTTGSDVVLYLALELPDPDDGYLDTIGTKGSTGADTAVTGLGFEPVVLGFIPTGCTADDTENSASAGQGFGFDDGTTSHGHCYSREPGGGVNDSFYDSTHALHMRVGGSATQRGYVSAIGSDGYTMTYTTSGSVVRSVVFGFGDSTATGGGTTITADFISPTTSVYEPTITTGAVTISADFVSAATSVYEPTVTAPSGAQDITADFISSATSVHEPTVTTGAVSIAADFISANTAVHEPTVFSGSAIVPDFIAATTAVYEPTITTGSVTIAADLIAAGTIVYEPTVSSAVNISADFISSATSVYEPTVGIGAVTIQPEFISSGTIVYEPSIPFGQIISADFIAALSAVYEPSVTDASTIWTEITPVSTIWTEI